MQFKTLAVDKLPERPKFGGGTPIFSDDDVKAAIAHLKKGLAISDDTPFPSKEKARNRAGVMRARIKATDATLRHGATVIADGSTFRWWVIPIKD